MDIATTLLEAGTAVVADVFDVLGRRPPVLREDLVPLAPGARFAGPAYTIAGRTMDFEGGDPEKLGAIDAMPPGCVAVWAGQDIRGVCCFGDLLATSMQARDIAGIVVDGGVRDSAFLASLELPIVARFRTPAQAIGRWKVTAVQEAIEVPGAIDDVVTVHPGDLIVVDEDGAVVVPADLAQQVAERAAAWASGEEDARVDIAGGMPLLEALDKHGHL